MEAALSYSDTPIESPIPEIPCYRSHAFKLVIQQQQGDLWTSDFIVFFKHQQLVATLSKNGIEIHHVRKMGTASQNHRQSD